ncbi:MAG: hypothetical protein ACLQOO_05675, partial [Terriglobia bacterium]
QSGDRHQRDGAMKVGPTGRTLRLLASASAVVASESDLDGCCGGGASAGMVEAPLRGSVRAGDCCGVCGDPLAGVGSGRGCASAFAFSSVTTISPRSPSSSSRAAADNGARD